MWRGSYDFLVNRSMLSASCVIKLRDSRIALPASARELKTLCGYSTLLIPSFHLL